MLTWLKKRVREDRVADEARAVRLVHEVFGSGTEDVTLAVEEPRTAA
ncbi:MAG: hypothetical protein H0W70_00970 [Actinobacteria bacterium]|nr:hypothetical protein [Actinomycetota bacterium]